MRYLITKAVLFVVAGLLAAPATGQVLIVTEEEQVTSFERNDFGAHASGDKVIFSTEYNPFTPVDLGCYILPDAFFMIHSGDGVQYEGKIDGQYVVYTDQHSVFSLVWLYDFNTNSSSLIATDSSGNWSPAISGNNVVYVSNKAGAPDIYWFDIATTVTLPVHVASGSDLFPSIDGDLVAWLKAGSGERHVYATRLEGEPPFQVYQVDHATDYSTALDVSGNRIAYISNNDVAVYDDSTGQMTWVTDDGDLTTQREVQIEGDQVYWTDDRNGNFDIFVHDLTMGRAFQLTENVYNQNLTDVDDGRVLYHDARNGGLDVFMLTYELPVGVTIDISPGKDPNRVNLKSGGRLRVAVLSTNTASGETVDFDATQVDAASVVFGPGDAAVSGRPRVRDVDRDGDHDLVLRFHIQETGIQCDDTEATLTGQNFDGVHVFGTDSITTVNCP